MDSSIDTSRRAFIATSSVAFGAALGLFRDAAAQEPNAGVRNEARPAELLTLKNTLNFSIELSDEFQKILPRQFAGDDSIRHVYFDVDVAGQKSHFSQERYMILVYINKPDATPSGSYTDNWRSFVGDPHFVTTMPAGVDFNTGLDERWRELYAAKPTKLDLSKPVQVTFALVPFSDKVDPDAQNVAVKFERVRFKLFREP